MHAITHVDINVGTFEASTMLWLISSPLPEYAREEVLTGYIYQKTPPKTVPTGNNPFGRQGRTKQGEKVKQKREWYV